MEYLNNILLAASLNTAFLIVWFLTNVFYEYVKLIIPKIKIFDDYQDFSKLSPMYFTDFLSTKTTFISKLLSCVFCLGFWSALFSSVIFNEIKYVFTIYIVSIYLFFLIKNLCCKN
jgi:hypothetical protein